MSSVLVHGVASDDSSRVEDSREVFNTISPSNPLDMDTSAPSTPINQSSSDSSSSSTPSTSSSSAVIDRLSRLRGVLDTRLTEEKFDPWNNKNKQHTTQTSHNADKHQTPPTAPISVSNNSKTSASTSSMLRIGFDTHGASRSPAVNSSSLSSFQSHPLAPQSRPSQLSAQPSSVRRSSVDETSITVTAQSTSGITGVAVSNVVPTVRSVSPLPSSSLSSTSSIPRSGSSSSLSVLPSRAPLPSFLKGGSSAPVKSDKADKTGKRKKVALSDDEDEEEYVRNVKEEEEEEKRQEEKRQQKKQSKPTPAPRKSTTTSSSGKGGGNRLNKLRGKAAAQAKIRNSRHSGGAGGGGSRIPKEEEEVEEEERAEAPSVHIVLSPTLNGVELDEDEAVPDSPPAFTLSPRKQLAGGKRLQNVSSFRPSSPKPPLSPLRSSTPDPIKRVKGGTRSSSPLPFSPAAGGSPSPSGGGSCARIRPYTGPKERERMGDPCEKDQWKGSWGAQGDDSEDSDDDEDSEELPQHHHKQHAEVDEPVVPPPVLDLTASDAAEITADVTSAVVPPPVPLVRRQSLRSHKKKEEQLVLPTEVEPISAPQTDSAPATSPDPVTQQMVEGMVEEIPSAPVTEAKGKGKGRKGTAAPAKKAAKGKGRKRVLVEEDEEGETMKEEDENALIKEKEEEEKKVEPEEEEIVEPEDGVQTKRGKPPPLDTSAPAPPPFLQSSLLPSDPAESLSGKTEERW